jgi:TRAP-type mannitol/chloroaromatic compound transport system permease small subunit
MASYLAALSKWIDRVTIFTGRLGAWTFPALMVVVMVSVTMRYAFGVTFPKLEEAQWYLLAIGVFLCMAYTYYMDGHIRVDLFHEQLSPRGRAWIELLGCTLLVIPVCIIVGNYTLAFVERSWRLLEGSRAAGGLPFLYLLKTLMLVMLVMLGLQALSQAIKSALFLTGHGPATADPH